MATSFPASIDALTNPNANEDTSIVSHAAQHTNANDAIEALEAKVGADGSAVTTSHDYKLGEVISGDKAVGKTATQTLTNKTLTLPQIDVGSDAVGDILVRDTTGKVGRVPVGTAGQVLTSNGTGLKPTMQTMVSVSAAQIQNQSVVYAVDSGTSTAYVLTLSPAVTSYTAGQKFSFKASNTNSTTAPTMNVNGLGAVTIKNPDGSALSVGQITINSFNEIVYDGTYFQLKPNTASSVSYSSGTTTKNSADASGTQNIAHSLGKIPKFVKITAYYTATASVGAGMYATTSYNGTTQTSLCYVGDGSNFNPENNFKLGNTTGIQYQQGVVTFDSTNIIITWTKTNSPTGTYQLVWEAQA